MRANKNSGARTVLSLRLLYIPSNDESWSTQATREHHHANWITLHTNTKHKRSQNKTRRMANYKKIVSPDANYDATLLVICALLEHTIVSSGCCFVESWRNMCQESHFRNVVVPGILLSHPINTSSAQTSYHGASLMPPPFFNRQSSSVSRWDPGYNESA